MLPADVSTRRLELRPPPDACQDASAAPSPATLRRALSLGRALTRGCTTDRRFRRTLPGCTTSRPSPSTRRASSALDARDVRIPIAHVSVATHAREVFCLP